MLNKDFNEYVCRRCEDVLTKDSKYIKLQLDRINAEKCEDLKSQIEISELMEIRAEELCFMQGFKEALAFLQMD